MTKIERVTITQVDLAPPVVRIDATQQVTHGENTLVEIFCDDGASGLGYTTTIGYGGRAIASLIERELAPRLIGRDDSMVEALWSELYRAIFYLHVGGVTAMAMAAIDTALWDLRCRRAGLPLYKAAGGAQERIRTYDTEHGWLQLTEAELAEGAKEVRDAGFRGMKIKVGRATPAEDARRIAACKEMLGESVELMVDANKAWTVAEALHRAEAFRGLGLAWLEEPLPMEDVNGHRLLRAQSPIPLALGETLFHPGQFKEYLHADAATILQPDVTRVGGITPWLKIAHLAEAYNVAVAPHSLMEVHLALACAVPNCAWLEYMPHIEAITTSRIALEDGHARPSESPGLGIAWDREAIARLRACEPIEVR